MVSERTSFGKTFPLVFAFGLLVPVTFAGDACPLSAEQIAAKMADFEAVQLKNLQHYRMTRTYGLKSADGTKDVQITALVNYDIATGKSIKILEERGSEGLFRRGLRKVIEAEIRTSHQDGREETRLSADNYNFRFVGTEVRDGRKCYILQLLPKRKNKYLLEGKAWIDAGDFGLVALEGRPAASVSFWVGKPFISQSFEKIGDFWLLSRNQSVVDAKLVGRIALSIETSAVEMGGTKVELAARPRSSRNQSVD